MFSEQLAVLLFIAATQVAGQGVSSQPMAQMPRGGAEKISLQAKADRRLVPVAKTRLKIKREREATMLAEFR